MNELLTLADLMSAEGPKIVTVGVTNKSGQLLCGLRRDNGLWTSPGGHMDPGESPYEAARREVFEETALVVRDLKFITGKRVVSHRTGKPFVVMGFLATAYGDTAMSINDPDKEVSEWRWVGLKPNSPELSPANRHAKGDLILAHFGLPTG